MYRSNKAPTIYSMISDLKKSDLKPIYFLFGEDFFTINGAIKFIEEKAAPLITTEFDKEIISVDKKDNLSDLIDLAYTFPFGSEKKLLIVKNFENYNNKKKLLDYIQSPSESTILVLANYTELKNLSSEPFKTLQSKNYIYSAEELKGAELEGWVIKRAQKIGFKISAEATKTLVEIVGEDKSLLDMQVQKFKSFLGENTEINIDDIKKLSSATKEYSIFDLLNSLGRGNKVNSIKVINNLLDHGKDMVFIISMLAKYFSTIAQSYELKQRNFSDDEAASSIGVSKYYYKNCKNAAFFNNPKHLIHASEVLYKTDLRMKTSDIDQKTLSTMMLTDFFAV